MLAGQLGEGVQVGRVAGHAVDAVDEDHPRAPPVIGAQQRLELVEVVVTEALDGRAAGLGHGAAVIDRLVRAAVQEQGAAAGQHRDHRHVDVGDRRQDERVLGAEQFGELGLDLLVEDRAAQQTAPAGVGPPLGQVLGDRVDDLLVEVQAQVVAGGVVGQPVVADPDVAPVDLVDDGVEHAVGVLEAGQVLGGADPALQPLVVVALAPAERFPRVNGARRLRASVARRLRRIVLGQFCTAHPSRYRSPPAEPEYLDQLLGNRSMAYGAGRIRLWPSAPARSPRARPRGRPAPERPRSGRPRRPAAASRR